MDADAKLDPPIPRLGRILLDDTALDFDRTAHGVDRTGKLDQHAAAAGVDDAVAMRSDGGINDGLLDCLELRQRAFLVGTHQASIAGDVRRQHCRQSSLYALAVQECQNPFEIGSHHNSMTDGLQLEGASAQGGRHRPQMNQARGVKIRQMIPMRTYCANGSSSSAPIRLRPVRPLLILDRTATARVAPDRHTAIRS